jgi:hypothetical protein
MYRPLEWEMSVRYWLREIECERVRTRATETFSLLSRVRARHQVQPHAEPFHLDAVRIGLSLAQLDRFAKTYYFAQRSHPYPVGVGCRLYTQAMSEIWAPALGCGKYVEPFSRLLEAHERTMNQLPVDRCMLLATPLIRVANRLSCRPVLEGYIRSIVSRKNRHHPDTIRIGNRGWKR